MSKKQTKHISCKLDIKAVNEDGTFSGYASVFNVVESQNDIIVKGAFKDSLNNKKNDIKLLWQHKT